MEVGMDIEDELFFADLNKQISLLIMDDDDQVPLSHTASVSLQAFSRNIYPATQAPLSYQYQKCTRESKGTGVFIPQSSMSHQRRRNRQAKYSSSSNSKHHKQQHNIENSRGIINNSHGSYMNILPAHNSFNNKHVDYR